MKRRVNSTGRRKIIAESYDFQIFEDSDGYLRATATLNLAEYDFPDNAVVIIEAYNAHSSQRFNCGTIANIYIPPELVLDQVDHTGSILFRIKVVDNNCGLIFGSADSIRPKGEDGTTSRDNLFPVEYRNLEGEVWKVDVDDRCAPVLLLNKQIHDIKHKLANDPVIQAFLLPAAFRIVLQKLVEDPDSGGLEDEQWKDDWLAYCKDELGVEYNAYNDNKDEWIDNAILKFCNKFKLVERIRKKQD